MCVTYFIIQIYVDVPHMKRDLRGNIKIIIMKTCDIYCIIGRVRNNNICSRRRHLGIHFIFHRFFVNVVQILIIYYPQVKPNITFINSGVVLQVCAQIL